MLIPSLPIHLNINLLIILINIYFTNQIRKHTVLKQDGAGLGPALDVQVTLGRLADAVGVVFYYIELLQINISLERPILGHMLLDHLLDMVSSVPR